jgi:integrase
MANKRYFSDRSLKALAPAAAAARYEIWDTKLPGFGVRVGDDTDKARPGKAGRIAFILYTRYPGHASPARRVLGQYGAITLEQARAKAGDWLEAIRKGIDPRAEEAREREAAAKAAAATIANSFAAVAEDFIREVAVGADPAKPKQRRGNAVAGDIRRTLIPVWGPRPITEITRHEVRSLIEQVRDLGTDGMLVARGIKGRKGKRRPMPSQAGHVLAYAKQIFSWALDRGDYGLDASPCGDLKAKNIVGKKKSRDRILSDDELFALWRAAGRLPYPHGPVYKILALTGLRLNEAADAAWPEFDLPNKIWTIPAERMKGKNDDARAHAVPLTSEILAILEKLPRFKRGKFLFSTTGGKSPVWMNAKVKDRIDRRMLRTLRALARRRGDDPASVELPHWTPHDIRRTVRSNLSRLRIEEVVREAVLAHRRPGMAGVYDHHDYFDEKRAALDLWAARLRSIVNPPPANVVKLRGRDDDLHGSLR